MDTSKYIAEFKQLEADLSSGSLSSTELAQKSKRHAFLRPIIEKEQELNAVEKAIADDRAMIEAGEDKELVKMAADELAELEAKLPVLQKELRVLVIPPDPNDAKNIYLEIRPGAGGGRIRPVCQRTVARLPALCANQRLDDRNFGIYAHRLKRVQICKYVY